MESNQFRENYVIYVLTSDKLKFKEYKNILSGPVFIQLHPVDETRIQGTYLEIVTDIYNRNRSIIEKSFNVLVDVSGISIKELLGLPGPYAEEYLTDRYKCNQIAKLYEGSEATLDRCIGYFVNGVMKNSINSSSSGVIRVLDKGEDFHDFSDIFATSSLKHDKAVNHRICDNLKDLMKCASRSQ